jgi:Tol biopolymer transport system component
MVLCVLLAACAAAREPATSATSTAGPNKSPQATSTPLPSVRANDIAYVRSDHIWRAHWDGSEPVPLTEGRGFDLVPAWTPDHTHIAFVHTADPSVLTTSTLCVVSASGVQVNTRAFDMRLLGLCYSPDGSRIALAGLHEGSLLTERVAIFDTASGKTTLVRELHDQFTVAMAVSWSPDGSRLLLGVSRQDAEGQRTAILTLGSGKLVWLKTPDACEAHWSPDGSSIVVYQAAQGYTTISVADARGTIGRVLVRGSGLLSGGRPVFGGCYSPDGARIAYYDAAAIWTIGADGRNKRRVIADGGAPAWSAR